MLTGKFISYEKNKQTAIRKIIWRYFNQNCLALHTLSLFCVWDSQRNCMNSTKKWHLGRLESFVRCNQDVINSLIYSNWNENFAFIIMRGFWAQVNLGVWEALDGEAERLKVVNLCEQCFTVKHYLDSEKLEANIGTFYPIYLRFSNFTQRKLNSTYFW